MKPSLRRSISVITVGVWLAAHSASAQYTIIELPGCGADTVGVGGLSRQGNVVSACFVESGNPEFSRAILPFLINRSGSHELPPVPGGLIVMPTGINSHGAVIANRLFPEPTRAFLIHGGDVEDLGTLGGTWSMARGINELGHVVGAAASPHGAGHAFLYRDGVMSDLGDFGGSSSEATAINGKGQIVINRTFGTNEAVTTAAAIYSRGLIEEITAPGKSVIGLGINSRGHVVGECLFTNEPIPEQFVPTHAFFFHDGQMEDLKSLLARLTSATTTRSINDKDEIVGSWYHYFDAEEASGGFYYRNGIVVDMTDLLPADSGWSIITADYINNTGQIVGTGYYQGNYRIYLLSPTKHNLP